MAKKATVIEDVPEVVEVVEPIEVPEAPAPKRRGRAKKTEVVETVEVPEPEPEPEPETVPKEEEQEPPAMMIARILNSEFRHRGDLPTLVEYVNRSDRTAYLLVDVGEPTLRKAWTEYTSHVSNPSSDEFLSMVNSAVGGARLFTGVARLTL